MTLAVIGSFQPKCEHVTKDYVLLSLARSNDSVLFVE